DDDIVLTGPASTQVGAYAVKGSAIRITKATANSSLILREGDAGTASKFAFVINDAANAVVVFSALSEKHNGSTNGSLTIPAGQSGFCLRTERTDAIGQDWRSNLLS